MTREELAMKINEKWMNTDTDDSLEVFAYKQGIADTIDKFMHMLPHSAIVSMSTIKEIAEKLKEQKK